MYIFLSGFNTQAFDFARNSEPFVVMVVIELRNDNPPFLMLDGRNMVADFNRTYIEEQSNPIQLSRGLVILDGDVGDKMLEQANITILDGKQRN